MELAALASAAIPDLSPTGVVGSPDDPRDFSAAVVLDRQGNRWRVRSPRHEEAAMRLETELQVLSGFTPAVRAALPFRVPSVAGAVRLDGLRTFVYHDMPGREMDLEDLTGLGPRAIDDIGRVISAVHALPDAVVENADLPVYTADQFRQRRLNELDQAATTGRIPSLLLRRWENALEEMELWDFTPVVVHGDLHEDNLLVDRGRVVSVTGWTDLHIGDPADDFSWLASAGDREFTDAVVTAYWQHRTGGAVADEHLLRRAALAAEFALAQWLVRGIAAEDEDMAGEAEAMLVELQADVEAHGGQEISLAPTGPRLVATPAPGTRPAGFGSTSDGGDGPGSAEDGDDDAVITDRDSGSGHYTVPSTGSHAAVQEDLTSSPATGVQGDPAERGDAAQVEPEGHGGPERVEPAAQRDLEGAAPEGGSGAGAPLGAEATDDGEADGTPAAGDREDAVHPQPTDREATGREPVARDVMIPERPSRKPAGPSDDPVTGASTTVIELDEIRQLHIERNGDA